MHVHGGRIYIQLKLRYFYESYLDMIEKGIRLQYILSSTISFYLNMRFALNAG